MSRRWSSVRRSRVRVAVRVGLAGWIGLVVAAGAPAVRASDLEADLDRVLRGGGLRGARVAALVVRVDSGETLYERTPDRALVPASNQKILTSLATLAAWGPTHRFTTEVLAPAPPDADGAVAALYVRGGGDPALTSEDLWRLAADLRRLGLTRIDGDIVLDDGYLDRVRWHPSWGRVSARAYHAPVGALNVNYGAFGVAVRPGGGEGELVRVVLDPPVGYLKPAVRATTVAPSARRSLVIGRRRGDGSLVVTASGRMPLGAEPKVYYRSVLDPTAYFGSVLALQLEGLGVELRGGVRSGATPAAAVSLLAFEGRPVSEVVGRFMKYSNNAIGETLVKGLGARASGSSGSWEQGMSALREELKSLGLELDGLTLVDGSGLSYDNRVSPRALVAALRIATSEFGLAPEFAASLPIAGRDGTLQQRAEEATDAVRAKTGLLTRVTALSGFARRPDGSTAVFSVIANGFRGSAEAAMRSLDGFAAAIAAAPPPVAER